MQKKSILLIFLFIFAGLLIADDDKEKSKLTSSTFSGLKFRSVGPAWNSGRISDFAVNPDKIKEYYIATSSGNLWKTNNGGITFSAIGDTLPYSLACVEIDPNNPHVVWVGSGENNHQRALGYGDGVYKSTNGGKTFKNVGLRESRQIGGLVIDPRNSNVVYVAAEGSAWGPGGERGLYKTEDGGKTWNRILEVSENTGINNIVYDFRNPDLLYATSEQRRRHPYTKIGGGPESAVYKSTDAGKTWDKIMSGLPKVHLGGMGIAVSPVNPDVVYLSVEAAEGKGGFFRTTNRGATWEKRSGTYSSGQYFNEIIADPKDIDKVYLMDVVSEYTEDGGKTWKNLGLTARHVDDHALWINPNDTEHLMIGGDGGIYESLDSGANWEFKANLPITQFYRVNVDNEEPFYNIYGGTQDNQSMGGPSQTLSNDGIVNDDWFRTVGGDGFFQAIDPEDPNIVYSEWQYGNIVRYDRKSQELLYIRPEPGKGEKTYKWYWDTPFFISPHKNTRLYIAAERVFKTEDRGESWETISGDLTTQTDRNTFKVMDKYWSIDAVRKDVSTSQYGLIIAMAESRLKENLLFVGTDDGIIQKTENAKDWTKISDFPDVPEYTPVHDVVPSIHKENVVYAVFNNHKRDDFTPYLLKSDNKGESWTSIAGNLPKNGPLSSVIEDPVNPNLLFVGTEWGVYFTIDGGKKWIQLKAGLPKVKVPDLVIQEREKDLVLATFGRGFYVLDDYSPIREVSEEMMEKEAHIFTIKDAKMFHRKGGKYGQGASYFKAKNPEFGAGITYYIKEVPKTLKSLRKKKEKELFKEGKPIPQPGYDELRKENSEISPYLIFTIKNESGQVVRKLTKKASSGISRIYWDLRFESFSPVRLKGDKFDPAADSRSSLFALPGKYNVSLSMVVRGEEKALAGPVEFNAVTLDNVTLPAENRKEKVAFQEKALELARKFMRARRGMEEALKKIPMLQQTALIEPDASFDLLGKLNNIEKELKDIEFKFRGQPAKASSEEIPPAVVPLNWRLNHMLYPTWSSSANITKNQKVAYEVLSEELPAIRGRLKLLIETDLKAIEDELDRINALWTPGRLMETE